MGFKKITIAHKRRDCIGCGSCALIAPGQRSMDPTDGLACLCNGKQKGKDFVIAQVDEDQLQVNEEAASACPMNIIQIHQRQ